MDTDSFGTGVRTRGVAAIDRFLLHRRLPGWLAGLAIPLTLPSLWTGRLADHFHHQLRLARSEEFHAMYP